MEQKEATKEAHQPTMLGPNRQLPVGLIAVMWFLGLIEWSRSSIISKKYNFRPTTTVVRKIWKRRILSVTSRVHLCSIIILNVYCGAFYIKHYFGNIHRFYRFASYLLSFWPLMVSVQMICLVTSFRRWFYSTYYSNVNCEWWMVFAENTISERFHDFDFSIFLPPKFKTFLFYCTCALVCTIFEITHFSYYTRYHVLHLHSYLLFSSSICNIWFFSLFCYFIQLQRIALQVHFDRLILFVKNHAGELSSCQAQLSSCFNDYLCIRRLIHPWITSVICATAFGLAVHIAWNYNAEDGNFHATTISPIPFTISYTNLTEGKQIDFNVLNLLIFVEKLLVLLLALLAVGGSNVNYIWKRCHFTLNLMYTSRPDRFWINFSKNVNHLNVSSAADGTVVGLLFHLLLIAIAVLSLQNFGF